MTRIILTFIFFTASSLVVARETTQPPSIALRTETSFVSEASLLSKTFIDKDQWQLKFELLKDIHNTAEKSIIIDVENQLAKSLVTNQKYIIAFNTYRKTKIEGVKTYIPLESGPKLIQVQGANPAIFRSHETLLKRLQSSPESALKKQKTLIKEILSGMQNKDPKIQEFFIREMINWPNLPNQLTSSDAVILLDIFNQPDLSVGSQLAFFENRPEFHKLLGVEKLAPRVSKLLASIPVNLDPNSGLPSLIFEALNFSIAYDLGDWDTYSRWTRSNNPSITEKALLKMDSIDAAKTAKLVNSRLKNSLLTDSSRRILNRYIEKASNL